MLEKYRFTRWYRVGNDPRSGGIIRAVLEGKIEPGKVFTKRFTLDDVQAAYEDRISVKRSNHY